MEELLLLIAGIVVLGVIVGPILAIRAFIIGKKNSITADQVSAQTEWLRAEVFKLKQGLGDDPVGRLTALEARLEYLESRMAPGAEVVAPAPAVLTPELAAVAKTEEIPTAPEETKPSVEAPSISAGVPEPELEVPQPVPSIPLEAPKPEEPSREFLGLPMASHGSFEMILGGKWLNWAGALMLLIGIGYGLKYAYDNSLIGPQGRLAIAVAWGTAALIGGEYFRRKSWSVLFHTLTGIGLAIYYLADFFSFQVYHLSNQTVSFGAAIGITVLAITLAVAHNALPIAVLAVLGGFLSPVLMSTGENSPYALFTYIAILDVVAMGAAYFRRWRALEFLCFSGTALMFAGWYVKFWSPDGSQLRPALIFISLFYLMFLLIPTLHSLARKLPETSEGIALVIVNALFSLCMYYRALYPQNRQMLGFFVLGQALLVFILFRAWSMRVSGSPRTAQSLLMISLGLVTLAIPLHLKLYGIPLAWAVEGVLFTWAGIKFARRDTRLFGFLALGLAVWNLMVRLPLHTAYFTPLLNVPFGSWVFVATACVLSAWLLKRAFAERREGNEPELVAAGVEFIAGFGLVCLLLTLETIGFWQYVHRGEQYRSHALSSVIVLWSVIPLGVMLTLRRVKLLQMPWEALGLICYVIGALLFLVGFERYRNESPWVFLHATFAARVAFIGVLWLGARIWAKDAFWKRDALETAGHVFLALLLAVELDRWAGENSHVSRRLALSLISVGWALQALVLIWLGLVTRKKLRRHLGFLLFEIVIGKVLLIDTSQLEKVYRIISFMATGVLLLMGGYFYHRYSELLKRDMNDTTSTGEAATDEKAL